MPCLLSHTTIGVTTPTIMNQTTCDVEGSSNIPNIKAQAIIQIIVNIKNNSCAIQFPEESK